MKPLWPHQKRGLQDTFQAFEAGKKCICFTSPTGGGKSRVMFETISYAQERKWRVVLYATRNLLIDQLMGVMHDYGITYGMRAADYDKYEKLNAPIQIGSIKTEESRVFKKKERNLHNADLVLWDESHMQKAGLAQKIFQIHNQQGAINLGLTATPLGLDHLYEDLIVAGNNKELRECGAHLPCYVYAPDEPELKKVNRNKTGEFQISEKRYAIWTQSIVGRVIEYYNRLNPNRLPTILFAPGVKESMWFVNQLNTNGIRSAHIDGNDVYRDGELYKSSKDRRKQTISDLRAGRIEVVCNRFVLREGIDIPELYHCILATPIGSLLSYIQTVGRVLRNDDSLDHVIVQDHGGNFWRHGSPNQNRDWERLFNVSERIASIERTDNFKEKKEAEPIVCPNCGAVRAHGPECVSCGFKHSKSVRMVVQENGKLKKQSGELFRKRVRKKLPDTEKKWLSKYYQAKNGNMTFSQAEAMFFRENHYWPPRNLPLMPKDDLDRKRLVKDVPTELLN